MLTAEVKASIAASVGMRLTMCYVPSSNQRDAARLGKSMHDYFGTILELWIELACMLGRHVDIQEVGLLLNHSFAPAHGPRLQHAAVGKGNDNTTVGGMVSSAAGDTHKGVDTTCSVWQQSPFIQFCVGDMPTMCMAVSQAMSLTLWTC